MPLDPFRLPHPGIQSLAPYVPGKSAEDLAKEQGLTDIIKLASNENPLGCSKKAVKALARLHGHQIATYPTYTHHPIYEKIANKTSLNADRITLGNGSDSLFTLFMMCFALHSDKHIITHEHAFISYGIQAKAMGIPVVTTPLRTDWQVDIDAMLTACNDKTAIIFLPNPNNPTGVLVKSEEVLRLVKNIPETTILVLDEAYHEYVDAKLRLPAHELLEKYPNLIITRTFSKAYGLAGLRLGYALANAEVTSLLHKVQPPFTVNQAALTTAFAALDDEAFIDQSIRTNQEGLVQIQTGLTKLQRTYLPTAGNFITFDCHQDASPVYQALLRKGIIVRPLHPYGLNNYLRVTIGTQEQNSRFLEALAVCFTL